MFGRRKKTSGPWSGLPHLNGFHDALPVRRAYNFNAMNKMAKRAAAHERPTPRPILRDLELGAGLVEAVGSEVDDEVV